MYRPAGATADSPVPVILHSHGWGGSRNSSDGAFGRELDRGFAVVSIDQRGFGQSGGQAHVQDPDLEGRDIIAVIDHVAGFDWVRKDAVGIPSVAPHIHEAFLYGSTTGQWPDGTVPGTTDLDNRFFLNGPAGFVDRGIQLDVPTLITQGFSDNLFNGNEGWHNFERTLTDEAREQSLFVGYNGGHALPNVAPAGWASGGHACVESAADLRLDFFEAVMRGENPSDLRDTRYSVTTADGDCLEVISLAPNTAFEMDDLLVEGRTLTLTGVGAVQHHEILTGPETITGVPALHAAVTSVGVDQRVFFALSVGTPPLDARVVQNNMMPLRELEPALGEPRTVELPAVAVEVGEGESLFLTISPISDMSFGHGSLRTPGAVLFEDVNVDLPLVRDEEELAECSSARRPDHAKGRVPEVCGAPAPAGR